MKIVIIALIAFVLCVGSCIAVAPACNEQHSFYGAHSNAGLITIRGQVYNSSISNGIKGAHLEVSCLHNGVWTTKSKTSGKNGKYTVFFKTSKCNIGDEVVINAEKDGWTGSSQDILQTTSTTACFKMNVYSGEYIPLVPEFGTVVGILTVISAIGVFFFVRKN